MSIKVAARDPEETLQEESADPPVYRESNISIARLGDPLDPCDCINNNSNKDHGDSRIIDGRLPRWIPHRPCPIYRFYIGRYLPRITSHQRGDAHDHQTGDQPGRGQRDQERTASSTSEQEHARDATGSTCQRGEEEWVEESSLLRKRDKVSQATHCHTQRMKLMM